MLGPDLSGRVETYVFGQEKTSIGELDPEDLRSLIVDLELSESDEETLRAAVTLLWDQRREGCDGITYVGSPSLIIYSLIPLSPLFLL